MCRAFVLARRDVFDEPGDADGMHEDGRGGTCLELLSCNDPHVDPMECSNQLKNMIINMIIKIVIFDFFTQVPGQTAILAGFAAFFYADSCRRYVKISFLSPFQDHFFSQKSSSTSTSMSVSYTHLTLPTKA